MGVIFDNVEFILGDCIEYLRKCEDDSFDLAIVDPPYGLPTDGDRGLMAQGISDIGKNVI